MKLPILKLPIGLILLATPLIEIYLFIVIGGQIGALTVIALIIITAVIGVLMLKQQGFTVMGRFRAAMARRDPPEMALIESVFVMMGAVLLLLPGFFTDTVGLLVMLPLPRRFFINRYFLPYLYLRRDSRFRRRVSGRIIDVDLDRDHKRR